MSEQTTVTVNPSREVNIFTRHEITCRISENEVTKFWITVIVREDFLDTRSLFTVREVAITCDEATRLMASVQFDYKCPCNMSYFQPMESIKDCVGMVLSHRFLQQSNEVICEWVKNVPAEG